MRIDHLRSVIGKLSGNVKEYLSVKCTEISKTTSIVVASKWITTSWWWRPCWFSHCRPCLGWRRPLGGRRPLWRPSFALGGKCRSGGVIFPWSWSQFWSHTKIRGLILKQEKKCLKSRKITFSILNFEKSEQLQKQ